MPFPKCWIGTFSRFLLWSFLLKREKLITHARCVYLFTFFLLVAVSDTLRRNYKGAKRFGIIAAVGCARLGQHGCPCSGYG